MSGLDEFAKSYLALQGVAILPKCRTPSRVYARPVDEIVPQIQDHERGDLP